MDWSNIIAEEMKAEKLSLYTTVKSERGDCLWKDQIRREVLDDFVCQQFERTAIMDDLSDK